MGHSGFLTRYPYTVAVADKNYFIKHCKKHFLYSISESSLNFIRLLRVVITPSVVVERRKRLEAIG